MNNTIKNYLENNKGKYIWVTFGSKGTGRKVQRTIGNVKMGRFNTACFMDGKNIHIAEFGMFKVFECTDYSLMTFKEIK